MREQQSRAGGQVASAAAPSPDQAQSTALRGRAFGEQQALLSPDGAGYDAQAERLSPQNPVQLKADPGKRDKKGRKDAAEAEQEGEAAATEAGGGNEDGAYERMADVDKADALKAYIAEKMPAEQEAVIRAEIERVNYFLHKRAVAALQTHLDTTADYADDQAHEGRTEYRGRFEADGVMVGKEATYARMREREGTDMKENIKGDMKYGPEIMALYTSGNVVPDYLVLGYVPLTDQNGRQLHIPILGMNAEGPGIEFPEIYRRKRPLKSVAGRLIVYKDGEQYDYFMARVTGDKKVRIKSENYHNAVAVRPRKLAEAKAQVDAFLARRQAFLDAMLPMVERLGAGGGAGAAARN